MAAMVAGIFHLDPIMVLKSDYFEWRVRLEAARYYRDKEEEANEKAKQQNKN